MTDYSKWAWPCLAREMERLSPIVGQEMPSTLFYIKQGLHLRDCVENMLWFIQDYCGKEMCHMKEELEKRLQGL